VVQVRPAESSDIDPLLVVERQCFNVPYYGRYMFGRRDFTSYLEDSDVIFLVAVLDAQPVGYVLGPTDTWREPPTAHIDSIAVLPAEQNKGIGSRLLRSFLSEARRCGCRQVTLEVSTANEAGLAFFSSHDFRTARTLPNYYGRGFHGLFMTTGI
jgi:ribosomal-protein-alanine N-acetyltransferase